MGHFTPEQIASWKANRMLTTDEVLDRLSPELMELADVVGKWVWLEFTEKPDKETRETIKALGFKWNQERGVWQHPCGKFTGRSKDDPELKYGRVSARTLGR